MIYQEVDDLKHSIIQGSELTELDMSCFTGDYVTGNITNEYLKWVESSSFS